MYYCDAALDHRLIIHRGDKSGPIIATGEPCLSQEGLTEIHFAGYGSLQLKHVHHKFLRFRGKTSFEYNGKVYHWRGHSQLVEDDSGVVLALFHPGWFELSGSRLGKLEITYDGLKMLDLVVITALIVQERSDEGKQAVLRPRSC
jgi:hypothetical protein